MPNLLVQYPTGHKLSIAVLPNKPLIKALESACQRRSLDPSKYAFVHNRRLLDLSVPFRFCGLVNNACVELVARTCAGPDTGTDAPAEDVQLCFRLREGDRVTWTGSSHTPIWSILTELSSTCTQVANELTSGDDDTVTDLLTVVHLQEQVIGTDNLRNTRPIDLGIFRGSALLQLVRTPISTTQTAEPIQPSTKSAVMDSKTHTDIAPPSEPRQSSMDYTKESHTTCTQDVRVRSTSPQPPNTYPDINFASVLSVFADRPTQSVFGQPEHPVTSASANAQRHQSLGEMLGITLGPTSDSDRRIDFSGAQHPYLNFQFPTTTAGMDLRNPCSQTNAVTRAVERQCILFRRLLVSSAVSTSAEVPEDIPDDVFELTEEDLRSLLQTYRKEWHSAQLQTVAMRKAARLQFFRKYSRAIIHFLWSDGLVLQACFEPHEQVSALYDLVQQHLREPQMEFQLYTTPPKVVLKDRFKTLIEADLVPLSKVYFSAQSSLRAQDVLRSDSLASATIENGAIAKGIVISWMDTQANVADTESHTPTTSDVDPNVRFTSSRHSPTAVSKL